jgi:hypothetical protein
VEVGVDVRVGLGVAVGNMIGVMVAVAVGIGVVVVSGSSDELYDPCAPARRAFTSVTPRTQVSRNVDVRIRSLKRSVISTSQNGEDGHDYTDVSNLHVKRKTDICGI